MPLPSDRRDLCPLPPRVTVTLCLSRAARPLIPAEKRAAADTARAASCRRRHYHVRHVHRAPGAGRGAIVALFAAAPRVIMMIYHPGAECIAGRRGRSMKHLTLAKCTETRWRRGGETC